MTKKGWERGRVPVVRGINNKILHSSSEVCLTPLQSYYLNPEEKKRVLFFAWGGRGGEVRGFCLLVFFFFHLSRSNSMGRATCDVRR